MPSPATTDNTTTPPRPLSPTAGRANFYINMWLRADSSGDAVRYLSQGHGSTVYPIDEEVCR